MKAKKNAAAAVDALIEDAIAEMKKNLANNLRAYSKNENPLGPEDAAALLQLQLHYGVMYRSRIPQLVLAGLEDLRRSRYGDSYLQLQRLAALLSRRKLAAKLMEDAEREYTEAQVLARNLALRAVDNSVLPSTEQLQQAATQLQDNP